MVPSAAPDALPVRASARGGGPAHTRVGATILVPFFPVGTTPREEIRRCRPTQPTVGACGASHASSSRPEAVNVGGSADQQGLHGRDGGGAGRRGDPDAVALLQPQGTGVGPRRDHRDLLALLGPDDEAYLEADP